MDFGKFSEYGLIGLILSALFFILWRLLVWVMAFVKDTIAEHNEERKSWLCTMKQHTELINRISQAMDEHDRRADERGKYIREEHREMIATLGRINGYKNS